MDVRDQHHTGFKCQHAGQEFNAGNDFRGRGDILFTFFDYPDNIIRHQAECSFWGTYDDIMLVGFDFFFSQVESFGDIYNR